jgi:hypothetical protein
MRIFERLPARAHAVQPQRKRYDGVIAALSRRHVDEQTSDAARDYIENQQAAPTDPERSNA